MSDEIFEKVKTIVVAQLKVDPAKVTMDTNFGNDLEVDSLDLVELIMAFEDEFGMEIVDEQASKLLSVKDVVDFIVENQK